MTHPDAHWQARIQDAFTWWLQQPTSGRTSSITGSGAIEHLERSACEHTNASHALTFGSATAALRATLQALGSSTGSTLLVAGDDWPAGTAAAATLGMTIVRLSHDDWSTTTQRADVAIVDPCKVEDFPDLTLRTGARIIEDRARLDLRTRADLLGDAAVWSFGPGKALDCGEGGLAVFRDATTWGAAVQASQHPTRHLLAGLEPDPAAFMSRMNPLTAVLAGHLLASQPPVAPQPAATTRPEQWRATGRKLSQSSQRSAR